jgi:chemotaxis response regulator CheB
MRASLDGIHQATYDAVFQHPISRNLAWRDVMAMLGAINGITHEQHNGTMKAMRNGRTLVMHQPIRKQMSDMQELMKLRRFLEQPDGAPSGPSSAGAHLLVVIDHRLARIYKAELHGSIPQRVIPYDRAGAGRHLHHVQEDSTGQRKRDITNFYDAVAKTLHDAQKILLFGSGTGGSSAMEQLLAFLRQDYPELARRVSERVVVDERQLTEDLLLARARTFYEGLAAQGDSLDS